MTTETKTYNGWTNYETWCVNLWLTNDEYSEGELRRIVNDRPINSMVGDIDVSTVMKADILKDWVMESDEYPSRMDSSSMFTDLLCAALENVNWREIVECHEHDDDE